MARVLGLDLGSHSVKALLVETTLRGYQLKSYHEVVRAQEGDRLETLRAALTELLGREPLQPDQVVIALPGPSLATHVLTLPFVDTKRLEAALPFEVESQLPFDLSEAVFDYQVVRQQEKKSELLVGVIRKDEVQTLLSTLQGLQIDPRIITHPGIAYQNLLLAAPDVFAEAGEGPLAVLDIGHERTTLAIGRPKVGVEFARTFPGGGKDLTRALANELKLSLSDAAHWKETQGVIGHAAQPPTEERASSAFVRGLQPVLRELRPSLKAYVGRTRTPLTRLYLCGGTARLPGLDAQLARDLDLPVQVVQLPADASAVIPEAAGPTAAQSLALALRAQSVGTKARFNVRRGEFAFKGDFDYLRDRVGTLAAFAAILLIALLASGFARNAVLARRERMVDAKVCDVTQRVLGRCEKNFDKALSMLKGKESPAAVLPKVSAVNLLAELAQRIPSDIPVKLDQIEIDPDRITVRCETESSKHVDPITTALKGYKCFREVKEGKVEKSRDGQKVNFRLDIQVECPDSQPPQG